MIWVLGISAGIVGLAVGLAVKDWLRLRRRPGLTKAQFLEDFQKQSVPENIVAAVYNHYTSVALGSRVAISADDNLEDLRIGQDDLDEDLQRLLQKLALDIPSSSVLKDSPQPLRTIGDVVNWLNWVSQHQGNA